MSVLVNDCLKLPSLREATVLGGKTGLDEVVSSVSVLEYAEPSVLDKHYFVGNEIIITAFVSIKNDVAKQRETILRLREAGVVALILYYVGVFMPCIDPSLIEVADSVGMPLIEMPHNRTDFRYGEAISDVLSAVFRDQAEDNYFVSDVLERVSRMHERERTVGTVMRLLSDRLHSTLLLADKEMRPVGEAAWPLSAQVAYDEILSGIRARTVSISKSGFAEIELGGETMKLFYHTVETATLPRYHLFAIAPALSPELLAQAAEVMGFFINVWQHNLEGASGVELVRAVLTDETLKMRQIARRIKFDIECVNEMWVVKPREEEGKKPTLELAAINLICKQFWEGHGKRALTEVYEDAVLMFVCLLPESETASDFEEELATALSERGQRHTLCCVNIGSAKQARESYNMLNQYWRELKAIYPRRHVFHAQEVSFARSCAEIERSGRSSVKSCLEPLEPLLSDKDGSEDSLQTLCTYLLDANNSVSTTAKMLFIHPSTVKYRLAAIKKRLGYDITRLPGAYELYRAAALFRLDRG
jgi:DNA-binding PucR family transcriptional regulator